MRLLSPILRQVIYPVLGRAGYFHRRASSSISVATYHGVVPESCGVDPVLDGALVTAASFRSQLRLLKKHYNVVSPERFLHWLRTKEKLPERSVLLTCDDGLLNNLTVMLPILKGENLGCLFFVTAASAGDRQQILWYVELYLLLMEARGSYAAVEWRGVSVPAIPAQRPERFACWQRLLRTLSRFNADEREEFLREAAGWWSLDPNWKRRWLDDSGAQLRLQLLRGEELKQLAAAGMTIGAHTMSHPVLSEQPAELAAREIRDCRQKLQQSSGQAVWALAYPFGDPASVGSRESQFAEAAGYECAFMNVGGSLGASFPRFAIPRIHVTADMSLPVFEAHASGLHDALLRAGRGPGT